MGTNSPDYDDVIAMQGIWHGDIEASDIVSFNSTNSKKKLLNNEELFLNIASPFNGTCTANVYGIGFDPNATPSY